MVMNATEQLCCKRGRSYMYTVSQKTMQNYFATTSSDFHQLWKFLEHKIADNWIAFLFCCDWFLSAPPYLQTTATPLTYSASQKNPPPLKFSDIFSPNGWEFLVQILHAYYTFLPTLDYKFVFNYLRLWRSYAILSATIIMCSKCPPSTETHAGWSHLIWHNFIYSWR